MISVNSDSAARIASLVERLGRLARALQHREEDLLGRAGPVELFDGPEESILLVAGSFLSTSQFYRGLLVTVKEDTSGAVAAISARAMKCKNVFTLEKEITVMVNEMKQGAKRV